MKPYGGSKLHKKQEHQLRDFKLQVLGWVAIERSHRRQCSRPIQIKEGDACTKFFHRRANGQRKRNLIPYLKDSDDHIVWSHEGKVQILQHFYSYLLGTHVQRDQALDWDRLHLCTIDELFDRPFTEDELENTVMMLPVEKAPGPDGFTGTFYKKCWQMIKPDVLAAMDCFYHHRTGPLVHLNGANIV